MKLHLPIALLAAVLSAVAYGGEPYDKNNFTQEGDNKYVYSNSETGVTYSYETAADGTISSTVTGDALSTKFYNFGNWTGTVVNVPYTATDWSASNTILNIGDSKGTSTSVDTVIGAGVRGTEVLGNKTTNIHSGAEVGMAIAGYLTWNNNTYPAYQSYLQQYYNNWGASDSDQDTTISLNISGKVSDGVFGHYISRQSLDNAMNPTYGGDSSFALKEAIDIKVNKGGQVDNIIVAGGFNARVDNEVSVTVNEGAQTKTIYGGVQNTNDAPGYVKSTHITVNGGTVNGNVYGGGRYSTDYPQGHSLVKDGTLVEINGGTVTGNVFGAGNRDTVKGGTHVVVNGKADIQGHIYGGGLDNLSTVEGDRVITFDNHGEVDWTKVHDFDAVEFTGTTKTQLGTDGQLAENYKKVTINNSYITGSIGHAVELDVTNNIHVALDGNLTTKADSEIVNNENAIQIGGNATFNGNGTKIENSTINAGGNIAVNSGSTVTNGNLVAVKGDVSFSKSTMNGGEITVGGTLAVDTSQVKVDKIHGGEEIALNIHGTPYIGGSSLEVNQDIKIAAGSQIAGWDGCFEGQQIGTPYNSSLTAKSITAEKKLSGNDQDIFCADLTATEGDISIGGGNIVAMSNLVAKDSVVLKDGASLTHGSTATAQTGDVWLNGGVKVENSDLIAENGIVKFNQSTMTGGKIVAGEALQMDNASVVVADSINNGKAVKLDVNSGAYLNLSKEPTAASLTVNSDLVLADGSKFEGQKKVPYVTSDNNKDVEGLLAAHSIKSEGAVTFDLATVKATAGNIELATGSSVTNTNLVATDSVQLTGTTMEGGSIAAGNKVVLDKSVVSVKSIGKDGAVVESTNKSKLEVTQGALVLNGGSVVKDSVLSSKEGVELRGTIMTGSKVETTGTFSVIKGSDVTMDSVEGLNKIAISDSSFTTGKVELSKGETITSQNSNFTATDLVVNGGNFAADGTIKANSITVSDKGTIQIGDAKGTSKTQMELNATGSQSGLVSGKLEITNTDLVVTGSSSSQFWIDGGTMTVDGKSNVDLSAGTTLRVGSENAGVLNVQGGSTLTGGANNLWVYDNSTINVSGKDSVMGVCNDKDHYNYRVLMGITNHDGAQGSATQTINVTDGGTFTSSATQFVTNFHGGTTTNITVSGKDSLFHQTGTNMNGGHYEVGTTGEWVKDKDGNWLDKGSDGVGGKYVTGNTDTITYLLSNGTDKNGVLGYAVADAKVNITAKDGGTVKFDSALTYVGNVGVNDVYINANKSNYATFTVGKDSSMSFKQMEVYANADVKNDGTFNATNINVNNGGIFNYEGSGKLIANSLGVDKGGVMNLGSETVRSNVALNGAGSGQTGIISGALNVTNTDLVVTGSSSSQFWIDGGTMTVDKGSKVDLSVGTTLRVGNENAGVLNVLGGSTLTGGANNLWVYDNSTINVSGEGSVMGVCNDKDHYNYRVLMGITNHDGAQGSATQTINVTNGGKFTSSATQFVTNFHSNTKTFIVADGGTFEQTGTNMNGSHYEVGTTGEWVKDKDGNWLDAGSAGVGGKYVTGNTDTITYLLSNGTDKDGVLGYPVENAQATIVAVNGGTVKFDSALTYVGNVGVSDAYIKANENNTAHFIVDETSNMSFKQMEVYATAGVQNKGTFNATNINVNNGGTFNYEGSGKLIANSLGVDKGGVMNLGSETVRSNVELNNAGSGKSGVISGKLNVTNTNLVLTDSKAGAFWIDGGVMTVDGKSTVDLSNGGTLCVGRNDDGVLNVQGGSSLTGADNNLWVYGDSTINVTGPGSSMGVCKTEGDYNYRVLMGITNHDGPQNPVPVQEQNLNVKDGGTFTSSATQFVTNFHGNTTTNITVSGEKSLFHQTGQNVNNNHYVVGTTGEWVQNADGQWLDKGSTGDGQYVAGHGDTITYLLSNGTDKNGVLGYAVSNAKVNISATEGGRVQFDSALTYVGNVGVNADYIEANKSNFATFTVGKDSSMSFKQLEIYADTKIDNQGTFNVESVNVNDGATLETLGSLDLNEVALAGGTLFNQGTLSMESLELEHASLLFAATSLTDASAAINYTGAQLTNFGPNGSSVSIDDMVDNFGIVLTGAGAQELIDAGETGVTFSFTLATGDATFLSQLDTVLSIEENLADFSITVNNDAILRQGDGELKNLQVTVEGDALVISGTAIIPEPTTATLSLLALAALAARRRRK